MRKLSTVLLFVVHFLMSAQPAAPIKWKNIPKEDLKMAEYALDPEAPAVVLCDYGQMYFDVNKRGGSLFFITERHVRIKILKEEGKRYAKIRIPFQDLHCESFQWENNFTIYAWVYNLSEKGKTISKKLKFKNINFIDSTGCNKIAEFTLPDVKVGSVIEYRYKISSLEMIYPDSWYFQTDIPVKYSEFRLLAPNGFQYLIAPVNTQDFEINEQKKYARTITVDVVKYNLKAKEERNSGYYDDVYDKFEKVKEKVVIDLSGNLFRFVKKDIPAFQKHKFVDNDNDYKQKLNIHLKQITKSNIIKAWESLTRDLMITTDRYYDTKTVTQKTAIPYPVGFYVYKLPDWKILSEDLLSDERFGLPLVVHWDFKSSLDDMLKGTETPKQKMIAIYDYIRENIKWNGVYDVFVERVFDPIVGKVYSTVSRKPINEKSLRQPFENRTGTGSEINFILIYLLNKAGIETFPVLVSTRERGKIDKNFPDIEQFNHVVAYTKMDNGALFLDATDSLRPFNLLKQNTIGVEGFIVRRKEPGWVKVKNQKISTVKTAVNLGGNNGKKNTGKLTAVYSGYHALQFQEKQKDDVAEILQSEFKNYHLSNIEYKNVAYKQFLQADINEAEVSEVFRIQPALSCKYTEAMFFEPDRTVPIEFDFPFEKEYELNLKIQEGYKVEYPQSIHLETYGKNAEFTYTASQQGNNLQVRISLSLKMYQFPAHEYNKLAELFSKAHEKLKEEIVISKGL